MNRQSKMQSRVVTIRNKETGRIERCRRDVVLPRYNPSKRCTFWSVEVTAPDGTKSMGIPRTDKLQRSLMAECSKVDKLEVKII